MTRRRPPGHASQNKFILALVVLLLAPAIQLVDAQQHQQQQPQQPQPLPPQQHQNHPSQLPPQPLAASLGRILDESGDVATLAGSIGRAASHVSPAEAEAFAASNHASNLASRLTAEATKVHGKQTMTDESLAKASSSSSSSSLSSSSSPLLSSVLTGQSARLSPVSVSVADGAAHAERDPRDARDSSDSRDSRDIKNTQQASDKRSTVAPDLSVRAPSPAHRDSSADSAGLGLASPHHARSLADWEVEDFVLLATVDGDLHSVDRKTGKTLWHTESEKPVVATTHHRANLSVDDPSYSPIDHWTWAIEPSGDGAIYLMIPGGGTGLTDTGLTMKAIVDKVPLYHRDHPVVFIGTKETTMMTLDAATGHVRDWYGSADGDSVVNRRRAAGADGADDFGVDGADDNSHNDNSCQRPSDYFDDAMAGGEECVVGGTITLGRIDYKVIVRRTDGVAIATLRYSEWGPNNYDNDLHRQYREPMDNRYITGKPSGDVYGFNFVPSTGDIKLSFTHRLGTPVVRVFDIARPPSVPLSSNPDLALLPQPPPPAVNDEDAVLRRSSVFVNATAAGNWYALSGSSYPLIVDAPAAMCTRHGWWDRHQEASPTEHGPALAGKHMLVGPGGRHKRRPFRMDYPTLSGGDGSDGSDGAFFAPSWPEIDDGRDSVGDGSLSVPLTLPDRASRSQGDAGLSNSYTHGNSNSNSHGNGDGDDNGSYDQATADSVITKVKELPQVAANRVLDFFSNPVLLIVLVLLLYMNQKDLRHWYNKKKAQWAVRAGLASADDEDDDEEVSESASTQADVQAQDKEAKVAEPTSAVESPVASASTDGAPVPEQQQEKEPALADVAGSGQATPLAVPVGATGSTAGTVAAGVPAGTADVSALQLGGSEETASVAASDKKKAHRGRRGGTKHRKGKLKSETSQSRGGGDDDGEVVQSLEEVVGRAKRLGERSTYPEPDIVTVPSNTINDMEEVSTPILRMGSLEVNQNVQLGTGSNGTVVFEGKFDGRAVAVKRMLIQFYDIASQETKLLRESDDHPNVIRYYAQQQRANFHYIALELCQASLADVVERPHQFRELALAGERDLPSVLYQVTSGLNHLHARSIVHRDLKPQNILVNMGPDGKPRLLISDFGLCKKLEGGQSSFGATTAHAAGTSGWRAPELLLDDDARESAGHQPMGVMEPTSAQSGSSVFNGTRAADGTLVGGRRATKAIDIFSLGLVFFYVLTKGSHPFDCGDRYMREVNIRKATYRLDELEMLGDASSESRDLIEEMISSDPRQRPRARQILSHPFFWTAKKRLAFLCDVSDHFEKEPRDPPSAALCALEALAPDVCRQDFLRHLPSQFVDSLGKQRKYTGSRLLDLLRALRNKRNHYEDMSESLRRMVGPLPEGYLGFWTVRFPNLLIRCWRLGLEERWAETDRFMDYYQPTAGV